MDEGLYAQGTSESLNLQKKAKKKLANPVPGMLNMQPVNSTNITNTIKQTANNNPEQANNSSTLENKFKKKFGNREY